MYIFTPPAKAFELNFTYDGIWDFITAGRNGWSRKVGTTITAEYAGRDAVAVRLYDTIIAYIWPDGTVRIPQNVNNFGSHATTWWLQKVLTDNSIPGFLGRENGTYWCAGQDYEGKVSRHRAAAIRKERTTPIRY